MSRVKVTVTKGHEHYFYETEEKVMKCPICKREYFTRKVCLYCLKTGLEQRIPTQLYVKQHTGMITKDLKKFSCDCIFGAWFRWGGYWRNNYPNSRCKHARWSMRKIEQMRKKRNVERG